jgi:hypothetical protein
MLMTPTHHTPLLVITFMVTILLLVWLQGQLGQTFKLGSLPVGTGSVGPIDFMGSGILSKSGVLKEVDSQDEVFTEIF